MIDSVADDDAVAVEAVVAFASTRRRIDSNARRVAVTSRRAERARVRSKHVDFDKRRRRRQRTRLIGDGDLENKRRFVVVIESFVQI